MYGDTRWTCDTWRQRDEEREEVGRGIDQYFATSLALIFVPKDYMPYIMGRRE